MKNLWQKEKEWILIIPDDPCILIEIKLSQISSRFFSDHSKTFQETKLFLIIPFDINKTKIYSYKNREIEHSQNNSFACLLIFVLLKTISYS